MSAIAHHTTLTFVGTGSCVPALGDDTACFVINGHCLIDCGWNAALGMARVERTPLDIEHILLTHCHHDHYMGLPGLLFYRRLRGRTMDALPEQRIIGPAEDIERVVGLARALLQPERFDTLNQVTETIVPVTPGAAIETGELRITTAAARHQVQGLAYRIHDTRTGAQIGFSGDTAYIPELEQHFRGVDVLVHEASHGSNDPQPGPEQGHSSARQAAAIASGAGAGRLYIVHAPQTDAEAVLAAAREVFPNTFWPQPGETVEVGEG